MTLPTIRYSRRQVALMLRVARLFDPTSRHTIKSLGLERDGPDFVWNPSV